MSLWFVIVCCITFQKDCTALHYSQPAYLHSLLWFHTAARSLKSSNINLLTIPFAHTSLGAHSFSVTSHKICNSPPPALHSCNCPATFRWHLKTHYFQQAFHLFYPQVLLSLHLRFGICWRCTHLYISLAYLSLGRSVVEWLGRRTHDSRSRVRLPVMTLPGYLFLRQSTVFGG